MTMTTGPAILVSEFLPKERGKVLGITVASVYTGLAVGPFAGGILTQQLDGARYSLFLLSLDWPPQWSPFCFWEKIPQPTNPGKSI